MPRPLCIACLLALMGGVACADGPAIVSVKVDPASIELSSSSARRTILVEGQMADGRIVDLTRDARFRSLTPKIAEVSSSGIVRGLADGQGAVEVAAAGQTLSVAVRVRNASAPRHFNFE